MIKPKKSLGQNFLIDQNILKKIVSLIKIEDKFVLEIGPGTGNLTSYILKNNPKKLIVVEKDKLLANHLKKKFESRITIINIIASITFIKISKLSITFIYSNFLLYQ